MTEGCESNNRGRDRQWSLPALDDHQTEDEGTKSREMGGASRGRS